MTIETIAAYCFVLFMVFPALYQICLVALNSTVTYLHKKIAPLGR